jgi:amidase
MDRTPFRSATELAGLIQAKKISSEELLDLYLARIDKHNARVNAVVASDIPGARRRARAADAALAKGDVWGPLHGVPVTIKDSFDLAGMPATWGVPELKDHRPATNALAVQRYIDAGAIAFGKTNVAAYLVGWATQNEIYGTTSNPWDLDRSPGGSSGGAAGHWLQASPGWSSASISVAAFVTLLTIVESSGTNRPTARPTGPVTLCRALEASRILVLRGRWREAPTI